MKRKSMIAAALCAVLLCGCGGGAVPDGTTVPTEPPVQTTAAPTETTAPAQTVPPETAPVIADDALSLLRADMKPHMAALGYLGHWFPESYDSPIAYLMAERPNYLASHAYLSRISRVYGSYGSFYCVIPRDPQSRVTVNHVKFEGTYPYEHLKTLEADAPGEPFFVRCVVDEETLLEIIITEPDGRTLRWYPDISEFYCEGSQLVSSFLVADYFLFEDIPEADPENAEKALDVLRADMNAPIAARATLDRWDETSGKSPIAYIRDIYPKFFAEHDYLADCGRCYGTAGLMYCVVPRSPDTTVTVNVVSLEGTYPYEKLDHIADHPNGEPFFLLSDIDEERMLEIIFTEPDGRTVTWYPYWNEVYGDTAVVESSALITSFTPPSELPPRKQMMSYGWVVPELSQIEGTCWLSRYYGYGLDLLPGGEAIIYDVAYDGDFDTNYTEACHGVWLYDSGYLTLTMRPVEGSDHEAFTGTYPILLDPYGGLWLGRSEADGTALPYLPEGYDADTLEPTVG